MYNQDDLYKILSEKFGVLDNGTMDPSQISRTPAYDQSLSDTIAVDDSAPSALGRALALGFSGLGDAITNSFGNGGAKYLSSTQDIFKSADERALKQKENAANREAKRFSLYQTLADKRDKLKQDLDQKEKDREAKRELASIASEERNNTAEQNRQNQLAIAKLMSGGREENRAFQHQMQQDRQNLRQQAFEDKQKEELNNRTERYGKDLASFSDPALIINNLEKENLGFPLDSVDYDKLKKGEIVVDGKKQDLPGISLPFAGRVSAFNGDARALDQTLQKLLNTQIKDRAGTAVSSNELERIKKEYGQGMYNSEADLLRAAIDYKKGLSQLYKTQQAKYDEDTKKSFKERGGPQYDDVFTIKSKDSSAPLSPAPHGQQVMQNGKIYVWDGSQYVEKK
jgi:hypothetical protein